MDEQEGWSRLGWFSLVRCPACGDEHRVVWAHPSFPARVKLTFPCPREGRQIVLFSSSCVWAEAAEDDADAAALERFFE